MSKKRRLAPTLDESDRLWRQLAVFHAGWKWVSGFKSSIDRSDIKRFGMRPDDLAPRFLAWLDGWTAGQARSGDQPRRARSSLFGRALLS